MANKEVLASVVLASALVGRTAMAAQILEAIWAGDPSGTYVIETGVEEDALVPRKDEDWAFQIVRIVRGLSFSDTVPVSITVTAHHEEQRDAT